MFHVKRRRRGSGDEVEAGGALTGWSHGKGPWSRLVVRRMYGRQTRLAVLISGFLHASEGRLGSERAEKTGEMRSKY